MNNNAEIQREAIIEIIGTQCDNCKVSHNPMILKQNLILKHQTDNSLDHDAVLLLTEDGKELGFLPQNYSSIYAAAIDSGRYTFSIKIVESESDTEKPVFTVKIISEPASNSEKKIESDFFCLLQNIVNDYAQRAKEYKTFIYSETVSVDELLSVLDKLRLLQQLISQSNDIIENSAIKPNSNKLTFFTKESLIEHLSKLKTDVGDILKKIQKTYNESLDIDDDAEYHRIQSEMREKKKKFRIYDNLLITLIDVVNTHTNIASSSYLHALKIPNTEPENAIREEKNFSNVAESYVTNSISAATYKSEPENNIGSNQQLQKQTNAETDTSLLRSNFTIDITKPFNLKDSVIAIFTSDAPEITKYRGYKNGLDSKNLRELIKKYYGKTINLFEISKTLMLDKTFRAVGKGCYIISATLQNDLKSIQTGKNNYVKTSTEPITTTDTIISYNEPKPAESIETRTEHVYKEKPVNTNYNSVSDTEQVTDAPEATLEQTLTIEPILEVIKENNRKLQYDDGFGAYEVKTLLLGKGFEDISEEQIENLMSECSELQQIEDGYYSLIDNVSYGNTVSESIVVEDTSDNTDIETDDATGQQEVQNNDDNRQIILRLNGDIVRAYDYSDALIKVCEFAINCKPFGMARIAGQETTLNGKNVFYRKAVPVDGYNKLSNGLQLAPINTVSDLQTVTNFIKKYCQIDDNMITIINQ